MSAQRPLHKPPAGQENYDEEALNEQQQISTNNKKVYFFLVCY